MLAGIDRVLDWWAGTCPAQFQTGSKADNQKFVPAPGLGVVLPFTTDA